MTTNQLGYFLSVAEHLNFTKAAAENYIAQTAISQQIAALERELDATLFKRTTRAVQLTEAGKSFYSDVKKILSALEGAVVKARRFDVGVAGNLSIGFPGKQDYMFLPEVLSRFRRSYPDVAISLTIAGNDGLLRELHDGMMDISFVFCKEQGELLDDEDSEFYEIGRLPLCVAMSGEHSLAGRDSLREDELDNETIIASYSIYRGASDIERLTNANAADRRDNEAVFNTLFPEDAILPMIEGGYGVTFWPMFRRSKPGDKLIFVPLEGESKGPLMALKWKGSNDNPVIAKFKEIFFEVLPEIMEEYPFI